MEIYKKLNNCKKAIKNTKMKKAGKNTFSGYEYFTPQQIEDLCFQVCEENNLLTKFDLKRNEFGVTGVLQIICIETSEVITYEMATAIPEIKATNIAQQLGGCVTYTERYLKTSAFGIVDNSLDFDAKEKEEKNEEKKNNAKDFLNNAIKEVNESTTEEILLPLWTKYKDLTTITEFKTAFNNKRASFYAITKKLIECAGSIENLNKIVDTLPEAHKKYFEKTIEDLKTKLK